MKFEPRLLLSKFKGKVEERCLNYEFTNDEVVHKDRVTTLGDYKEAVGNALKKYGDVAFAGTNKGDKVSIFKDWMQGAEEKWLDLAPDGKIKGNILNFNGGTVDDLASGGGHENHAFAGHYRLHMHVEPELLKFADDLDKRVFGYSLRLEEGPVFKPKETEIRNIKPKAPFAFPPYMTEKRVRDLLEEEPEHGVWLDPHNHHSIPLFPRPDVKDRLDAFMDDPRHFLICPVIGPSGAGKTRFISEWMAKYVPTVTPGTEWEAGILNSTLEKARDPKPWKKWKIKGRTLIVIDYTFGYEKVVRAIVENARSQGKFNVRLIVVDHIFPKVLQDDYWWREIAGAHSSALNNIRAELMVSKVDFKSEGDESRLLRQIISASANVIEERYLSDHRVISSALQQLDRMGHEQGDLDAVRHPLFAALLGQAIRKSDVAAPDFSKWSRHDLISVYFNGPDRFPWEADTSSCGANSVGVQIGCVVSAATLRRGLPKRHFRKKFGQEVEKVVDDANRIVSSHNRNEIKPLLPDILGEAFLLSFLQFVDLADDTVKQRLSTPD